LQLFHHAAQEDFFTYDAAGFCAGSGAPEDSKLGRRKGDGIPDSGVLYLHGLRASGKTSLLLQLGFTQAKKGKSVVLVMCGSAGLSQQQTASEIVTL
jgi:archaellum biogenesis ATPase FlaH